MSEAADSGIQVTDIVGLSNGDNTLTHASPDIRRDNIPLNVKDNEENDNTINGVGNINHVNGIEKLRHNLQTTEGLITVIKFRSRIVLVLIICSVILSFQIPIILYYTDQPTLDLFTIPDVNLETCSVRFM